MSTTPSDTQAALDAGVLIGHPQPLDDSKRFVSVVVPAGAVAPTVFDIEQLKDAARLGPHPGRKKGIQTVQTPESFIAYMAKHALTESEVWADIRNTRITAVINANMGTTGDGIEDYAGWADHRLTYQLQATPAWTAWLGKDAKWLRQVDFAEHIEDRVIDIVEPDGATMLEIAQSFLANRKVKFESSRRLKSSETQLEYREEVDATAGKKGNIAIPDNLTLGIVPFEGSAAYKITARFRYRINDGELLLSYKLDRPEDVTRNAFNDVVTTVDNGITGTVWSGVAP